MKPPKVNNSLETLYSRKIICGQIKSTSHTLTERESKGAYFCKFRQIFALLKGTLIRSVLNENALRQMIEISSIINFRTCMEHKKSL